MKKITRTLQNNVLFLCDNLIERRQGIYVILKQFPLCGCLFLNRRNMYNNQFMVDSLTKQKDRIDDMIKNYQNQPLPVNNIINTGQTINKDLIEWRILNENEEVDNLYVQNKTLFISDNLMVLKGVDGKLEKWEVKKIYPVDKKDQKISELEEEIKKLKEMINCEHTKSTSPTRELEQSNANDDEPVVRKSKTSSKSISE